MPEPDLEERKLALDQDRFEWEKKRDRDEQGFARRHVAVIVSALLSAATVVVSGTQIYIAHGSKDQELRTAQLKNERDWSLQVSQLLIANKSSMTSDNKKEALFVRNVALATFPPDVTARIFQQLADITEDPEMKTLWSEGKGFAVATVVAQSLPAPEKAKSQPIVSGLERLFSVDVVSGMFPFTAVGNIKAQLPFVLQALEERGLRDQMIAAYALAIIRAEAEPFLPIDEGTSRFNTSPGGQPFDLYENRMGNKEPGDGQRFRGRGYLQLTGRDNYVRMSRALGLGDRLVKEPEFANDSKVAAQALAHAISERELQIRDALTRNNLMAARRLANGGSHGLAPFAQAYKAGLELVPAS